MQKIQILIFFQSALFMKSESMPLIWIDRNEGMYILSQLTQCMPWRSIITKISGTGLTYTAKLLFHQSPTRHSGLRSDYHCDDEVTVL